MLLLTLIGCQTPRTEPAPSQLFEPGPAAQMDFWHALPDRPLTTHDEAFHGLLLLFTDTSPATYDERVARMKELKLLDQGFHAPPEQAVDRGTVAVAICRGLKIRGGLVMSLTGATPRYAVRELRVLGLLPAISSPNQTLSGAEFVSVVGAVQDYQTGDPSRVPASVMPSEVTQRDMPNQKP